MAARVTLNSATAGPIAGDAYMDNVAGHLGRLYDAASFPLTAVSCTGNAVTAALDPVLLAGLVTGMKFTLTWSAANTGGVTLAINGGSGVPVVDAAGAALTTGVLKPGGRAMIEYTGPGFRILAGTGAGGGGGGAAAALFQRFTVSGTWTKPTGYSDDHMVLIEGWGGGGGGGSAATSGGGGGGGYALLRIRYADLPVSVTVTIGAGGSVGAQGGDTVFGSLMTARRGLGGASGSGGTVGAGGDGGKFGNLSLAGFSGGKGGNSGSGFPVGPAGPAESSYFGGGGGAATGSPNGSPGESVVAGNGGSVNVAGSAPAGGGGRNAAGARGEVRIWL